MISIPLQNLGQYLRYCVLPDSLAKALAKRNGVKKPEDLNFKKLTFEKGLRRSDFVGKCVQC